MKYFYLIGHLLVNFHFVTGLYDSEERIKPQIYGSVTDKFTAKWLINKARELTNELYAEREDNKNFIEGDMRVTTLLTQIRNGGHFGDPHKLKWRSNIIPYIFDQTLTEHKRGAIEAAIKDFHQFTVMRFIQRTNEPDYLNFIKGNGCWSFVGMQGGKQDISIGNACGYRGTVIHEMMHALGFFHEHTRPDREKYLTIESENIEEGYAHNFVKYENRMLYMNSLSESLKVNQNFAEYDYFTIMHIGCRAFSSIQGKTIEAKDDEVDDNDLGQRVGFSKSDIDRLKAAYSGSSATENANDLTTFKPNHLWNNVNANNLGSLIKTDPLNHNLVQDLAEPATSLNQVEPLTNPNEPLSSSLNQLNPLTTSKPLYGSLDPAKQITSADPLDRLNLDKPENRIANPLALLKPLTSNRPLDGSLDHLNPLNSKDPLPGSTNQLNTLNTNQPLDESIDKNEPLNRLNPLNSNQPLAGSTDHLKPVISLNQLNTPLMKTNNPLTGRLNFDLMSYHEQLAATGQLDARPHPQFPVNLNPSIFVKPAIPGNPGPGIHNNIGGIVGVDGIGPNGLPVTPDINTFIATQTTTLFPMTTPIPMTTLIQRHVVMPEDSSCKCAQKSSSCICRENVMSQQTSTTVSSQQQVSVSPPTVSNACSYATLAYPCWPDDFVWSNDGLPPNCNCGPKSINPNSNPVCRCNCIKMHTHKSDTSWSNNLLCFRDTQSNPRLVLSKKKKMTGRKCLRFPQTNNGWKDTFLCMDEDAPYHLFWSRNESDVDQSQCLVINEPNDKEWDKMFLCHAL